MNWLSVFLNPTVLSLIEKEIMNVLDHNKEHLGANNAQMANTIVTSVAAALGSHAANQTAAQ